MHTPIKFFDALHLCRLMVSAFINEYLISSTCNLLFGIEEKLEQKLGFNLVLDNSLMNNLIAGSFG
jgi:hypothetical protein